MSKLSVESAECTALLPFHPPPHRSPVSLNPLVSVLPLLFSRSRADTCFHRICAPQHRYLRPTDPHRRSLPLAFRRSPPSPHTRYTSTVLLRFLCFPLKSSRIHLPLDPLLGFATGFISTSNIPTRRASPLHTLAATHPARSHRCPSSNPCRPCLGAAHNRAQTRRASHSPRHSSSTHQP